MSTWGDIGLPPIDPQGYRYDVAAGLLRTSFSTSNPRQRRQNESNKRTFELQAVLDSSQLSIALGYLNEFGYTWFALPLLTGSLDEPIVSLCVRLTKEYQVSVLGKGVYRLGFTVEQLVERSIVVTTPMYPIYYEDDFACGRLPDFTGSHWLSDYGLTDTIVCALPTFTYGLYLSASSITVLDTLSASVLPHFTGTYVRTNQPYSSYPESMSIGTLPAFTGTYIRTQITHSNPPDTMSIGTLPNFTGTLT